MADLRDKQRVMATAYVKDFRDFLVAFYKLTNDIGRAADAGIVWDDVTLHADPQLVHIDAADVVAAEGLMNTMATYLSTNNRRQIIEKMTRG